ncbi:hypothetical protein N7452_008268 [Penicillium brevicompactum]|uniref:Uncharacterized protein n=1 Tax=Penicillium brevicompactum TaxID=5074 RepID=A0A9W9Q9J8_PENBR|nr:hypothetical protein N7452_008268 [Penicillium brevicompactum]
MAIFGLACDDDKIRSRVTEVLRRDLERHPLNSLGHLLSLLNSELRVIQYTLANNIQAQLPGQSQD